MATSLVLVGLGATGVAMTQSLLRRTDVEIVGAIDRSAELIGSDLGSVAGAAPVGVTIGAGLADLPAADLAIVATTSDLDQVAETIVPLVESGYNVLSICEELAFPWQSHPEVAVRIDAVAKAHGVTVLGTGANPGVLMDTLPLLLTALTQRVERVVIRRRTSMARYGAILTKFGLGLTEAEFAAAQRRGGLVGHYGFEQSIGALAGGLGWDLDEIVVDPIAPAVVSGTTRVGDHVTIGPGQISAVRHAARGLRGGEALIDLEITFGFYDESDPIAPGDDYRIEGAEQTIALSNAVGFESFLSTIAAAANTATAVVDAPPGLLSMGDLPVRALASKGAWLEGDQ